MKTIIIYSPTWYTLGGGEKYMLLLAEVLSSLVGVSVVIVSDNRNIDQSQLEKYSGTNLSKVQYRVIQGSKELHNLLHDVDLFVSLSTFRAKKTSCPCSVQILQIPYGKIDVSTIIRRIIKGQLKETIKDFYRLQLHTYARKKVSLVLVYSDFVKNILLHNFSIRSEVLYPPIQDYYRSGISKKNIILSVGRIFKGLYNDKRYDILTGAFRRASRNEFNNWEYHIVGSASSDPITKEFIRSLQEENKGYKIYFHTNEPYDSLVRLYNEASIFWHGAGYSVDEKKYPENVEHFGMTTVEAMSAGCIPVVIDKGGQHEIITDGVNGYLWNTTEELISRTSDIINSENQVERIRQQARQRYEDFDMVHFRKHVVELFAPLLE